MEKIPLEIERRYLIRRPDETLLVQQPGCRVVTIEQIYLLSEEPGVSRRIRAWTEEGTTVFRKTEKRAKSALIREERESEIDEACYRELAGEADPRCRVLHKTRYRIPYRGQCVEVDVFPFWPHQALAEVELCREEEPVYLPPYLAVLREVTEDRRYTNRAISRSVPPEETEDGETRTSRCE